MHYITTSRPYTNATPHLGTAIDAVYADSFTRFARDTFAPDNQPNEVVFSMGTDEHSFKIADKAMELNTSPKQFVDQKYIEFKNIYDKLDINYDSFDQNSTSKHHFIANIVWDKLVARDLIYSKTYSGTYCTGCEDFKSESQLENGKCPIHPNLKIQNVAELNYFFRLSSFKSQIQDFLLQVNIPDQSVILEMQNFVVNLEDISISRDRSRLSVDWGIPVQKDPSHVMYVWFEALLTYLSALVSDELFSSQDTEKMWSHIQTSLPQDLMVIGRDNSKFHLVILPALLMGLDLPTPQSALIHGMINDNLGRKFAKSLGNGVELTEFIEKMGVEGVRFFVLHDCNPIGDTNFEWNRVIESYNANLANNLGNLVSRVSNLVEKFHPKLQLSSINNQETLVDSVFLGQFQSQMNNLNTREALRLIFEELTTINQYLEQTKPWSLAKNMEENQVEVQLILERCVVSIMEINSKLIYFLPVTSGLITEIFSRNTIAKSQPLFERISLVEL